MAHRTRGAKLFGSFTPVCVVPHGLRRSRFVDRGAKPIASCRLRTTFQRDGSRPRSCCTPSARVKNDLPAAAGRILPQFGELRFWILVVEGADSGVERNPSDCGWAFLRERSSGGTFLSSHGASVVGRCGRFNSQKMLCVQARTVKAELFACTQAFMKDFLRRKRHDESKEFLRGGIRAQRR
jgi:hypothetical protein